MLRELYNLKNEITDAEFDTIFPDRIRQRSRIHYTPCKVAFKAAEWLCSSTRSHILDIGSGAGKFCIAAALSTSATITGIEHDKKLVTLSRKIVKTENIERVNFIHGDIINFSFKSFTSIYFYNAFHEIIPETDSVKTPAIIAEEKYKQLSNFLYTELEAMPVNTRLATYCGYNDQVPSVFKLKEAAFNNNLRLWIKEA